MANPSVNKQASKHTYYILKICLIIPPIIILNVSCLQIDDSTAAHRTSEPPEVSYKNIQFPLFVLFHLQMELNLRPGVAMSPPRGGNRLPPGLPG